MPLSVLDNKTPFEMLYGIAPDYDHCKFLGVYVMVMKNLMINLILEVSLEFLLGTHMDKKVTAFMIHKQKGYMYQEILDF